MASKIKQNTLHKLPYIIDASTETTFGCHIENCFIWDGIHYVNEVYPESLSCFQESFHFIFQS